MSKPPMTPKPMAPRPIREWTLMFYFASDNPLAPSTVSQLKSLKAAGFHADANVIARFDPFTRNTPSHIYEVNLIDKIGGRLRTGAETSDIGFNARDPFVHNLVLDKIWDDDDVDGDRVRELIAADFAKRYPGETADTLNLPRLPKGTFTDSQSPRESLAAFLDFCQKMYPARHYMLFILGHGVAVGNDIFLFDSDVTAPGASDGSAPQDGKDDGVAKDDGAAVDAAPGARGEARGKKEEQARPKREKCADEPDFRNSLTLRQLGCVLRNFKAAIDEQEEKGKFELVGFHSCSMSGVEVAYELQGTADYMLASQGPAFVGSWPYRQMLLRIFNDIDAMLMPGDLADGGLLAKLRSPEAPAAFLSILDKVLSKTTRALLDKHNGKTQPTSELTSAIVRDFNEAPDSIFNGGESAPRPAEAGAGRTSAPTKSGPAKHKPSRARLAEILGEEVTERPMANPRNVRHMLTRLFYYVLYNSLDFQLAGYSFDLCLCDLTKVDEIRVPLDNLAKALIEGLRGAPGLPTRPDPEDADATKDTDAKAEAAAPWVEPVPLARELMLLAHWDAQSFFQENYTDLYDFCFRLRRRCEHVFPALKGSSPERVAIRDACKEVMKVLEKSAKGADDSKRFIVRAEFTGPDFQYSRGLSIFFPWTRPTDGFLEKYRRYKLVAEVPRQETEDGGRREGDEARKVEVRVPERETAWADFLDEYFRKTERETSTAEENLGRKYAWKDEAEEKGGSTQGEEGRGGPVQKEVLELLSIISAKVFSPAARAAGDAEGTERLDGGGGTAGKDSDSDTAGPGGVKESDSDTSGDGCGCASIKNYPHFTGMSQGANKNYRLSISRPRKAL